MEPPLIGTTERHQRFHPLDFVSSREACFSKSNVSTCFELLLEERRVRPGCEREKTRNPREIASDPFCPLDRFEAIDCGSLALIMKQRDILSALGDHILIKVVALEREMRARARRHASAERAPIENNDGEPTFGCFIRGGNTSDSAAD